MEGVSTMGLAERVHPVEYIAGWTFTAGEDRFMYLEVGTVPRLFVASSSRAGRWYEIVDNKCCCEAATHGLECRHIKSLRAAVLGEISE